jgi:hypothetical protein
MVLTLRIRTHFLKTRCSRFALPGSQELVSDGWTVVSAQQPHATGICKVICDGIRIRREAFPVAQFPFVELQSLLLQAFIKVTAASNSYLKTPRTIAFTESVAEPSAHWFARTKSM